jgi:hypothetical protein
LEAYEILKHPERREFYDKTSDISDRFRFVRDPAIILQIMISPAITYLMLILSIVGQSTDKEKKQTTKSWTVLIMVSLFLLEFLSLIKYSNKVNFVDYILPTLSVAERRELI